jgi:hypothetical protein
MKKTARAPKGYEKLKPKERFSLIMAALVRNDKEERQRLMDSAPQIEYSAAHHRQFALRFCFFANLEYMELLALAAEYRKAGAVFVSQKPKKGDDWDEGEADLLVLGYAFKTALAGWHKFCAELNLDPEFYLSKLPGFGLLEEAREIAGTEPGTGVAASEDGVARYLARQAGQVPTEDEQLEEFEALIQDNEQGENDRLEQLKNGRLKKFWPLTAEGVAARLRDDWKKCQEMWEGRQTLSDEPLEAVLKRRQGNAEPRKPPG